MRFRPLLVAALLAAPSALAAGGTIQGTVSFQGEVPKAKKIDRRSDPACAPEEGDDESLSLTKDGKVRNVLVRLIDAPALTTVPASPVVFDQTGCTYSPRVVGVVAGQKLQVKNSDGTLHNVHGYVDKKTVFNRAQPPGAPPLEKAAPIKAEVVTLKCDLHPWMAAFAVVVPHAWFAVSDGDGAFAIENVPAGQYTLESWHERLGPQRTEVTVAEGKTSVLQLPLK